MPICVHAQAAAFAARRLLDAGRLDTEKIAALEIVTYRTAIDYPGCAETGPLRSAQEARMSIPFAVASVLVLDGLTDRNFAAFGEPRIAKPMRLTRLRSEPAMDAAFPARQQARVRLILHDGTVHEAGLDDLPPFGPTEVRARFRDGAAQVLGPERVPPLEAAVDGLRDSPGLDDLLNRIGRGS